MILSGLEIQKAINKEIFIEPFDEKKINPNSYNLSLHNELLIYDETTLDMKKENRIKKIRIPEEGLILEPNQLYLGRTVEKTFTQHYVPMLEGRSSVGRLGLSIHITAGFGDIGFSGYWTLEIYCIQAIKIYPFIDICQLYFHTIKGPFLPYISGKYQHNDGIQASKLFEDFQK